MLILSKKIVRIGDSSGIIIDKPIMKKMGVHQGELIEFCFKKIKVKK